MVTVGMGCDHAHLPVSTINCKEIDLMGSFRYANTVSAATLLQHCTCRWEGSFAAASHCLPCVAVGSLPALL